MKSNNKKRTIIKTLGFGVLFVVATATAIAVPISIQKNKEYSLETNFETWNYEGNRNRIYDFIDKNLTSQTTRLNGTLKAIKNKGTDNEINLTSEERSLITVDEAWEAGLFELDFKSDFYALLEDNYINYSLEYVKPYYNDSSYPTAGIKFFWGEGASYFETIFEFRDSNLYGFKKSHQQTAIDTIINDINKNPNDYFKLKEEIGYVGQPGLYAKNIKYNNFDLNSDKLQLLRKNNYWISVDSVKVNNFNPTLLRITFSITYNDGYVSSFVQNRDVMLGNFDIEYGVDDPKSKVEKFINDNKDWINNLYQYFSFTKNKDDEKEYSVREAFEKDMIKFTINYSINSKLNDSGIEMNFKYFNQEDPNELSAFNYESDSTTPKYRIYFSSYKQTPLQYTKYVDIIGLNQQGDFKKSQQEEDMDKFNDFLRENSLNPEDVFQLDNQANPLGISDFFMNNNVSFDGTKYSIPFFVFNNQYKKYIESNKDETLNPLTQFKFKVNVDKINNASSNDGILNIANQIVDCINNLSLEDQLIEIKEFSDVNQGNINLNVSIGSRTDGTLFTSWYDMLIDVSKYFESSETYISKLLDNVVANNKKIDIKTQCNNENYLVDCLRNRKWEDIFTNDIYIYDLNNDTFEFPDLQFELKTEINYDLFKSWNKQTIEDAITNKTLKIEIIISMNNIKKIISVNKTFDELINK